MIQAQTQMSSRCGMYQPVRKPLEGMLPERQCCWHAVVLILPGVNAHLKAPADCHTCSSAYQELCGPACGLLSMLSDACNWQ